jgi:hypothetical protein
MHSLITGLRSIPGVLTGLLGSGFSDNGGYNGDLENHTFTIEAQTAARIPSLTTLRHRYSVEVVNGDEAADPTDFLLEIAYYSNRAVEPDDLTWIDLSWDEDNNAYLVVGPDAQSDLYLAPGAYFRTIRTKARPQVAIELPIVVITKPAGR